MEYRALGRTGVQVSRLCFGTMTFGRETDEAGARRLFDRCRECGINFFDCANTYGAGRAEEILGRLMRGCRDELVITSKVRFPCGRDLNAQGLSRRHIQLSVEASLERLGTDRIDLYFAHGFDELTPMEETLRAFDDLVHQGKVLYLGVSNWAAWQSASALGLAARERLTPIHCIQPMYNLVKRQAEVELLPLAAACDLGVISYSPLGGGLLTGKYVAGAAEGRLKQSELYRQRYADPRYLEVVQRFVDHARQRGVHPASLAVAWVLSHPVVTAPILGARDLEQLEPSLAALDVPMTPEWRAELSALGMEPPPATDRLEEKSGLRYGSTKP